jgi:DNA-binding transcriptional regulator LsrR (DeoR family)
MIVDSADAAASIRRQPHVADAIQMFDKLTKAIIAIGSWDPPNSELLVALGPHERDILLRAGVRAEVCITFFGDDGRVVRSNLTDRAVSITGEQLLKIPEVIAVAGGQSKVKAIRAVLMAGFVTTLVTDADTARELVESAPNPSTLARTPADSARARVE